MKEWNELLEGEESKDIDYKYGPFSPVVYATFHVLNNTTWFKRVGQQLPAERSFAAVSSWDEAIAPLISRSDRNYGPNGHLQKPSQLCIAVIDSESYHTWWQQARDNAFDYYSVLPYIPKSLSSDYQDFLDEYVYEFISFLLAEIIGADVVGSTYFREMLSYFYAGHFPCGWVGSWPEGRMRVY